MVMLPFVFVIRNYFSTSADAVIASRFTAKQSSGVYHLDAVWIAWLLQCPRNEHGFIMQIALFKFSKKDPHSGKKPLPLQYRGGCYESRLRFI